MTLFEPFLTDKAGEVRSIFSVAGRIVVLSFVADKAGGFEESLF
jgi:hypothetical protein